MQFNYKLFQYTLFLLLTVVSAGCFDQSVKVLQEPVPQTLQERIIAGDTTHLDIHKAKRGVLDDVIVDTLVFNIYTVITTEQHLYTRDIGDQSVKKYDKQTGAFIQKFGKGKGRGPGEIINPLSVHIDSNGNVWIVDNGNRRITVFNESGDVEREISINASWGSGLLNYSGERLLITNRRESDYFQIYDISEGKEAALYKTAGNWVKNQHKRPVNLTGEFIAHPSKNIFYYLSSHDGWLYSGTFEGEEVFLRKTIDNRNLAPIDYEYVDKNTRRVNTHFEMMQTIVSIDDSVLYVWRMDKSTFTQYIDLYSAENGDYLKSIKYWQKPECRLLEFTEGYMYMMCDEYITRHPIELFWK